MVLDARRAGADRRPGRSSTTSSSSPTRSTSTSCSTTSEHVPLATLPGMARAHADDLQSAARRSTRPAGRSAGCAAPTPLVAAARTAKQFLTYVNGAPFQPAIAAGLRLAGLVLRRLRAPTSRPSATASCPASSPPGSPCTRPQARTSSRSTSARSQPDGDGMAFCRALPERCGVVAIPNEVFYANRHEGRHLVRFAFCKRLEVLDEAAERLAQTGDGIIVRPCGSPPFNTTSPGTTATPTSPASRR